MCEKEDVLLFSVFLRIWALGLPDQEEHRNIILTWDRLGETTLGGIKERGKSGRQIYMEVRHEIFTTHYYNIAGTFLQGLSCPSSNEFKPTPLGLLRYLHKLRAKSQDMDKGKEIRAERG